MARSAADKAEQAADALEAFLRERSAAQPTNARAPRHDPAVQAPPRALQPSTRGLASEPTGAPLRLPHTDWLRHRLRVTGPTAALEAFRRAASGAGTIPWRLDLESLQDDWFHQLVNPARRSLSLAGARVLAGQLREAVERRHAHAIARVGRSRACPFDLHALVPVPAEMLDLGPDHPHAVSWLWQHWGTTDPLRHVAPDLAGPPSSGGQPAAGDALRLVFWSADWTPWRALTRIRADWPSLHFDVQPDYATGA